MKIGLIDVDNHAGKKHFGATIYPNLALCKISAYHKAHGDSVEWYSMFSGHCDIVYVSKIFNFSPDIQECIDADTVIKGGTGYDIKSCLPDEIDRMQPDYSIYPLVPADTAYGFLTRGCPNHCKWCVVPRKEGAIRPYMDIEEIITSTRRKAVLMDNNILAAGDYALEQFRKIIRLKIRVDFNQALDARLVNEENAELLAQILWIERRIRFGCDTPAQVKECERAMELINSFGYTGQYFLYTMLNDNFVECYNRIHHFWEHNQRLVAQHRKSRVYPYAQPFRDPDNPAHEIPQWQKYMANWTNKKMIFEKIDFADFEPRKGFFCKTYLEQYGLLNK